MTSVEAVDGDADLVSWDVNFPVSTTDGLTTGVADADPLVVMLLAIGCGNGEALVAVDVSVPTDPFVFRCPEKIIESFLSAGLGAIQAAAELRTT